MKKQKNIFYRKLLKLKRKLDQYRIPKFYKKLSDVNLAPIFIIGSNRSGTSIVSSLFSQHPDLEGIFRGNLKSTLGENGHSIGFCESNHIWSFLDDPESDFNLGINEGMLWGHPKHISKYYKDDLSSIFDPLSLPNAIENLRKTVKTPLIKDQWNILRVGLIKKILPNAKFILVYRNFANYIDSCKHKWENDKVKINTPNIGIHWYVLNNTAIFDLKKYSPKQHHIICYNDLFQDEVAIQKLLNDCLSRLKLKPFEFDLSVISSKFQYAKTMDSSKNGNIFSTIESIFNYETKTTNST